MNRDSGYEGRSMEKAAQRVQINVCLVTGLYEQPGPGGWLEAKWFVMGRNHFAPNDRAGGKEDSFVWSTTTIWPCNIYVWLLIHNIDKTLICTALFLLGFDLDPTHGQFCQRLILTTLGSVPADNGWDVQSVGCKWWSTHFLDVVLGVCIGSSCCSGVLVNDVGCHYDLACTANHLCYK